MAAEVLCAGTLRNDGSGWELLRDAGHEPTGLTSVTVLADRIRVGFALPADKVVGWSVDPDETMAAEGYDMGPSVGLDHIDVFLYRSPRFFIADYVSWSGTAWSSLNKLYTGFSHNPATGLLTLTHRNMGTTGSQAVMVTGRGNPDISAGGFTATTSQIAFAPGAPDPAKHRAFVVRYGFSPAVPLNPADVVSASGNIWIVGHNAVAM